MADAKKVPAAELPKLRVDDLHVVYRGRGGEDVEAVRGVTFDILDKPGIGEIVVFLGPSGCGKSTILKAVAGLLPPTAGTVVVEGQPVTGPGRDRGMVFQQYTSFGWLTVQENVEYGLRLQGVPEKERREQARKILAAVGLEQFAGRFPKELSGGMKQRVAIARTLINRPKLLLMDEPFGALDPQTRWEMQGMLIDISHREDNTILFVTHDVLGGGVPGGYRLRAVEAAGAHRASHRYSDVFRSHPRRQGQPGVSAVRGKASRPGLFTVGGLGAAHGEHLGK